MTPPRPATIPPIARTPKKRPKRKRGPLLIPVCVLAAAAVAEPTATTVPKTAPPRPNTDSPDHAARIYEHPVERLGDRLLSRIPGPVLSPIPVPLDPAFKRIEPATQPTEAFETPMPGTVLRDGAIGADGVRHAIRILPFPVAPRGDALISVLPSEASFPASDQSPFPALPRRPFR